MVRSLGENLHSSPARIAFAASPSSPFHPPLFLSTSSPSSPRSSHRFIFCLRRLSIRPPSLAVVANAHHLRFDHLVPARRARPCASRIPAQDHALKDTVVTSYRSTFFTCFSLFRRYAFVLGAPARSLAVPLRIILGHRTSSPSFQPLAHYRVVHPILLLPSI